MKHVLGKLAKWVTVSVVLLAIGIAIGEYRTRSLRPAVVLYENPHTHNVSPIVAHRAHYLSTHHVPLNK